MFFTLGLAYFVWHWSYFGQPLPTPFYRKGGWRLYPSSLFDSLRNGIAMSMPVLPLTLLGFRSAAARRALAIVAIPVVGFLAMWLLISNEMNIYRRFQYPILPVLVMSVPLWCRGLTSEFDVTSWHRVSTGTRRATLAAAGALAVGLLILQFRALKRDAASDFLMPVGTALASHAQSNRVMAVSEAGLLPLYSGWPALDTWGLNDPRLARQGGATAVDLDAVRPALIMYRDRSPYVGQLAAPDANPWTRMTVMMGAYARQHGYVLAGVFGSGFSSVCYFYVRPDLARDGVVEAIQAAARPFAAAPAPIVDLGVPPTAVTAHEPAVMPARW